MKTFKQLLEDIEITDNTRPCMVLQDLDTLFRILKDSFRPVQDITSKGGNTRKFN